LASSGRGWFAAILLLSGSLPLVVVHLSQLWARVDYRCFPVILLAAAALLWRDRPQAPASPQRWNLAPAWWLLSLLLIPAAFLLDSPWLGMLSFCLTLRGCLVWLGYEYFGGWWLTLLLLPIPLGYDQQFTFWLQGLSTRLSSRFLDWQQVLHIVEGNTLRTEKGALMVAEACSGISSLVALMAFAAAWSAWLRRSAIGIIALAAVASFWAVLMNSVRIAAIAWASVRLNQDWTSGVEHELLGMATFLLAAAGLWSTEPMIYLLTAPIAIGSWRSEELFENPWIRGWNREVAPSDAFTHDDIPLTARPMPRASAFMWTLGVVSAAACVFQIAVLPPVFGAMVQNRPSLRKAYAIGSEFLPAELAGFANPKFEIERRGQYDMWGEHSRRWNFAGPGGSLLVSIDFPFLKWHPLENCYEGVGWKTRMSETRTTSAGDELRLLTLESPTGETAHLAYLLMDDLGEPMASRSAPQSSVWNRLVMASRSRGFGRISIQIQSLLMPAGGVTESQGLEIVEAAAVDAAARTRSLVQSPEETP
jgi:exosortase